MSMGTNMSNAEQPMDHVPPEDGVAREETSDIEQNIKARGTWLRLVFMVLLAFAWSFATLIICAVVVVNFCYVLITGETNSKLTTFGHQIAKYLFSIAEFMTFNTDSRPFPFDGDWPSADE